MGYPKLHRLDGESTLARNLNPKIEGACRELGTESSLLSVGWRDDNRSLIQDSASRVQSHYITPSREETRQGSGFQGDLDRARAAAPNRRITDLRLNTRQHDQSRQLGIDSPSAIWTYGQTGSQKEAGAERLAGQRQLEPNEIVLGLTVYPHEKGRRDSLADDPYLPHRLQEQGLLETTAVIDNLSSTSPIVYDFGRPLLDRLTVKALAGFMGGILQFGNNRSLADVAHEEGRYSPLLGLSYGLRYLLPGRGVPFLSGLSKRLAGQERGFGDLNDFIDQTIAAGTDALTLSQWRAIESDINRDYPAYMNFIIPLHLWDDRWEPLITHVERWIDHEYPWVTAIWVSGTGTPHPWLQDRSSAWVQASLLYPLPQVPKPLAQILGRTPKAPNGQVKALPRQRSEVVANTSQEKVS